MPDQLPTGRRHASTRGRVAGGRAGRVRVVRESSLRVPFVVLIEPFKPWFTGLLPFMERLVDDRPLLMDESFMSGEVPVGLLLSIEPAFVVLGVPVELLPVAPEPFWAIATPPTNANANTDIYAAPNLS